MTMAEELLERVQRLEDAVIRLEINAAAEQIEARKEKERNIITRKMMLRPGK